MRGQKIKDGGTSRRQGNSIFRPLEGDVERRNSQTRHIVHRDGSISERVLLQVPSPIHREELICKHYLKNHIQLFCNEDLRINILSRDSPWDFDLEISTGERFFIEITAIADNAHQFEMETRQGRLIQASRKQRIPLRELRRLSSWFTNEEAEHIVAGHRASRGSLEVVNPFFDDQGRRVLFTGRVEPSRRSLLEELENAIARKTSKPHEGKERTVLILDYRGNILEDDEVAKAREAIEPFVEATPFPEIWFYVGYFSDDDGNNAEFTLAPLKLPCVKVARIHAYLEQHRIEDGRILFR